MKLSYKTGMVTDTINRHNYLKQAEEDKSLRNASVSKVQV